MIFITKLIDNRSRQAGDTIVEVLICIAVVGLALAGGYALSNHSLQSGLDSSQRSTALLAADGQVEFLKNAQANDTNDIDGIPDFLSQYTANPNSPFCIDPTNGNSVSATNNVCRQNGVQMSITYNNCSGVFYINPQWSSFRGNQQSDADLYYKLPDNFNPNAPPRPGC